MSTLETISADEFEKMLEDSYTYKLNVADVVKGVVIKTATIFVLNLF